MARRAPGKHYRKGISLIELTRMFPDDATAEAWFAATRWPDGPRCPHCDSDNVLSGAAHKTMPYRCRAKGCRKRFSVKTGTVMEASNIGYQKWAMAMYLSLTSLKSVSSMKLHRDLDISQKSAWHMAHRLRQAFAQASDEPMAGPVEVDETFVGGKRKNMSNAKRAELADAGRGTVGKTAVAGIKDRATNQVRAEVVPDTTRGTLQGFVGEHAAPGATIYTDEATAYAGLPNHETVRHSVGEYVRDQAHTNGLESFWAALKRAHDGTFHKMSPKHLDRYVQEFAGKHNVRGADTRDQLRGLVADMDGQRLTYDALIAPNGLSNGARKS